jgi:hypothetical protein
MQTDLILVSVQQRLGAQGSIENKDIPIGARRVHGQNAAGEHASALFTDPAEVAALDAVWEPYAEAVRLADEQGDPWPEAPRLIVSVTLAP